MKIRKLAICILLLAFIICCAGVLIGCKKSLEPPYYVRLDVFQPDGQLLPDKFEHYITLKYDGNPKVFDFKVYSIGQKKYINDDDIKDGTLNAKMSISVKKETDSHHFPIDFEDKTTWPTEAGYYEVSIEFNTSVIGFNNMDLNYRIDDVIIYLTIEEE